VKHLTSESREQVSLISIEFDLDVDVDQAANDVRDRVARVRNDLPDEVEEPIVAKRDSDANAQMWITLSGARYDQIRKTISASGSPRSRSKWFPHGVPAR
jgi:multidrug efflux pump